MTAIILINWNGADDTLACLNSLLKEVVGALEKSLFRRENFFRFSIMAQ